MNDDVRPGLSKRFAITSRGIKPDDVFFNNLSLRRVISAFDVTMNESAALLTGLRTLILLRADISSVVNTTLILNLSRAT